MSLGQFAMAGVAMTVAGGFALDAGYTIGGASLVVFGTIIILAAVVAASLEARK